MMASVFSHMLGRRQDDDDEEEDDDASDDDAQPTLSHTQSSPQSGSRSEDGAAVSPPDLDNHQAGSKRSHDVMNIDRNEERVSPLLGGHSPPKLSVSLESASAAKLQTPAAVAPGTRTSGKPQKKVSVVLTPRSERVRDMFSRVKKRSDIAVTTISTKRLCSMIRNLCSHVNWTTAHPGVTVDAVRIYPRLDPSAAAAAIPGVPTEGWSPSESTLQVGSANHATTVLFLTGYIGVSFRFETFVPPLGQRIHCILSSTGFCPWKRVGQVAALEDLANQPDKLPPNRLQQCWLRFDRQQERPCRLPRVLPLPRAPRE